MRRLAFPLSLAVLLAGWEIAVRLSGIGAFFMVPPSTVARRLGDWAATGRLFVDVGASLALIASGLGLAAMIAIPAGLAIGLSRPLERALTPSLLFAYATPAPVLVPLVLMWFGFTSVTRVVIVAMFAFLPIVLNVWWGARDLDAAWLRVGHAFGANRRELLWRVLLPGSVGSVLAALRVGGGLALIGLFVAETYGVTRGIGYQAVAGAKRMDVTGVLAGVLLLGLLGLALDRGLVLVERRLAPWRMTS